MPSSNWGRKESPAFMPDYYHAPALVLSALLLPAYGYLYLRFRDTRTLRWFLGFAFALASMTLRYIEWPWSHAGNANSWTVAAGLTCIQISSALFLASLSPSRFRLGRWNVLFVIPYTIPVVIATLTLYGYFHGISPSGTWLWIFPILGTLSLVVALFWGAAQTRMPGWLGVSFCAVMGSLTLWACLSAGAAWALTFAESANLLMTAMLLGFVFRRVSPGVILSALGFTAWSLTALQIFPSISANPALNLVPDSHNCDGQGGGGSGHDSADA